MKMESKTINVLPYIKCYCPYCNNTNEGYTGNDYRFHGLKCKHFDHMEYFNGEINIVFKLQKEKNYA